VSTIDVPKGTIFHEPQRPLREYCLIELQKYAAASGLLTSRRAVITAAAGTGIGFATAQRFVEEGASVVVSDRHERRLGEAAERLRELAVGTAAVHAVACDVTVGAEVEHLYAEAADLLGGIDVAVNNAGLGHTSDLVATRDEDWLRVLDITLTGTFRCLRAALPRITPGGSIINVGSVTAHRAERGQSAYGAAKAGVHALTRCAAVEAAEFGVRVNAVAPTLAVHAFIEKVADPKHLDAMRALQPQGRAAEPWEIANTIVFLASDLSGYLTGECISASSQKP
jgi:3-oxoacyl-[acyl-carrier protein] reductase